MKAVRIILAVLLVGLIVFAWGNKLTGVIKEAAECREYVRQGEEYVEQGLYQKAVAAFDSALGIKENYNVRQQQLSAYELGYDEGTFSFSTYTSALSSMCAQYPQYPEYWEVLLRLQLDEEKYNDAYNTMQNLLSAGTTSEALEQMIVETQYVFSYGYTSFDEVYYTPGGQFVVYNGWGWGVYDAAGERVQDCDYIYISPINNQGMAVYVNSLGARLYDADGVVQAIAQDELYEDWTPEPEIVEEDDAQEEPESSEEMDESVEGTDEYAEETDEYAEETDEYVEETNEYAEGTDEYAEETDEYVEETDEYAEETDEYAEETDEYAEETDEYVEETDEYAEETDESAAVTESSEEIDESAEETDESAEEESYELFTEEITQTRMRAYGSGLLPVMTQEGWQYYSFSDGYLPTVYEDASSYTADVAAAEQNGVWHLIDTDGQTVCDRAFDDVLLYSNGVYTVSDVMVASENGLYSVYHSNGELYTALNASDADIYMGDYIAFADENGLWGFADLDGNVVIEPQYAQAKSFSNGFAAVYNGEAWGFITKDNQLVIDYQFRNAEYFTSEKTCMVGTVENQLYTITLRF